MKAIQMLSQEPTMFRIAFNLPNGEKSHGSYCLTKELAEAWLHSLNKQYPEMQHWIEEEESLN